MSTHGDMLGFFPELMQKLLTYAMAPKTVAGYKSDDAYLVISGCIQNVRAGDLSVEGNTLNDTNVPHLWTRSKLEKDAYIVDPDGVLYKRTKNNDWKREGAFTVYQLETVIGNTETQTKDTTVTLGVDQYD